MTRDTVVWIASAVDELARLWLAGEDRSEVVSAAHGIDGELRADPETKGEAVSEDLRTLSAPPLRVLFTVRAADRIAEVLLVRRI